MIPDRGGCTGRIQALIKKDGRYGINAYLLVMEALSQTLSSRGHTAHEHIGCRELAEQTAATALQQYGPYAALALRRMGIGTPGDMGNVLQNLALEEILALSKEDSPEAFANAFDFTRMFTSPFREEPPYPDTPSADRLRIAPKNA